MVHNEHGHALWGVLGKESLVIFLVFCLLSRILLVLCSWQNPSGRNVQQHIERIATYIALKRLCCLFRTYLWTSTRICDVPLLQTQFLLKVPSYSTSILQLHSNKECLASGEPTPLYFLLSYCGYHLLMPACLINHNTFCYNCYIKRQTLKAGVACNG